MELKKSLALLAGAGSLLAFTPVASHAQDATTGAAAGPFADVPADHWAYNAVKTLQDAKIVIGYPDGTYGGRRPMTRYEFATAIARLLPLLNPSATTNNYATKDDLAALSADLNSKLAANQAALDALTRLVNEFRPELQQLGQDVSAIQTRLANLEGRVAAVEAEQQRFRVTGDVNFIAEAANSTHKSSRNFPNGDGGVTTNNNVYVPFHDKNGIPQGTDVSNRLFEASDVYHDILLHLQGRLSDTASVHVDLDFGNYVQNLNDTARAGFGSSIGTLGFGTVSGESGGSSTSNTAYQANVYQAYLDAPVSLGPLGGAALKVGRFGTQLTKWTLKQQDADVYTNLYQTDSGNILMDGGWLGFKLGAVGAQAFAGKYNSTPFSQAFVGTPIGFTRNVINPVTGAVTNVVGNQIGAHPLGAFANNAAGITNGGGVRFTAGSPQSLVFGATVEQFAIGSTITGVTVPGGVPVPNSGNIVDPNRGTLTTAPPTNSLYNRVSVYGLDVNGGLPFAFLGKKKGAITVQGAYNVSAEGANTGFNNVGNKARYQSHEELAGFNLGKLGVQAGYQFIGPYYSAPGYWGKVGAWTNPTNVKGPVYFLKYPLTTKLSINADYEQYRAAYGDNENGSPVSSPINGHDHINRYQAGLGYGLSSAYAVDLGYERVEYDLRNGDGSLANSGKPVEDYVTIGVGHDFNKNASFKLLYQIVHYNDKNTGFGGTTTNTGDANYSGDIAVGQFSLKF